MALLAEPVVFMKATSQIAGPNDLRMWLAVNGHRYQDGSTRTMVFKILFLIHYLSRFMSLAPGDIVSTGTPPGVGTGLKPPRFLKEGDAVELEISGHGRQRQLVIAPL